ncbi:hypothetical protein [Nocardia sp. N2S4-5]|uniref:hypothetical protein n=1 Tax=Nocardia sp. N2S4-5 TaxID=3351565 RepID=UPI0037D89DBE
MSITVCPFDNNTRVDRTVTGRVTDQDQRHASNHKSSDAAEDSPAPRLCAVCDHSDWLHDELPTDHEFIPKSVASNDADAQTTDDNSASSANGPTTNRRSVVENLEFAALSRRIIRAYARRVGAADPAALAELVALQNSVDEAMGKVVAGLRAAGYSWTDIARELGVTRQAARQRWQAAASR